ncbi:MAG: hypothetical protein GY719_25215 [bacterium]|nr:hypothetical protein [bacterium]
MSSTLTPKPTIAAVENLRGPVLAFDPRCRGDVHLKAAMLALASQLEGLHEEGDADTLEAGVAWTALFSFPTLVAPGPRPGELVSLTLESRLVDEDAAATLQTLARIRKALTIFDPPGFTAALWRSTLLSIYGMVEHFILLDDDSGVDRCFELLDTAEEMAGRIHHAATTGVA